MTTYKCHWMLSRWRKFNCLTGALHAVLHSGCFIFRSSNPQRHLPCAGGCFSTRLLSQTFQKISTIASAQHSRRVIEAVNVPEEENNRRLEEPKDHYNNPKPPQPPQCPGCPLYFSQTRELSLLWKRKVQVVHDNNPKPPQHPQTCSCDFRRRRTTTVLSAFTSISVSEGAVNVPEEEKSTITSNSIHCQPSLPAQFLRELSFQGRSS